MADAGIWWSVVRRSFGVPDLVGDEVALERIASLLLPDPAVGFGGDRKARDAWVQQVVDQITVTGEAGGLDRLLVDEADAAHVATGVAEALGPGRAVGDGAPSQESAARYVLEMLLGFLERHPFEATAPHVAEQPPAL